MNVERVALLPHFGLQRRQSFAENHLRRLTIGMRVEVIIASTRPHSTSAGAPRGELPKGMYLFAIGCA